jgi:hypothetical protein
MYRERLEISKRAFGKIHEKTTKSKFAVLTHSCVILWCIAISHSLGFVLWNLNEYAEAKIHFRRAVGIKEIVMQPNDNSTATSKRLCRMKVEM